MNADGSDSVVDWTGYRRSTYGPDRMLISVTNPVSRKWLNVFCESANLDVGSEWTGGHSAKKIVQKADSGWHR